MAKYTAKQQEEIAANPYTLKVTDTRVYFTADFKEKYWLSYQNGESGKEILKKFGYDPNHFDDSTVYRLSARIKAQGIKGEFTEGVGRRRRKPSGRKTQCPDMTAKEMQDLWVQVQYLSQEVELLKRLCRAEKAD